MRIHRDLSCLTCLSPACRSMSTISGVSGIVRRQSSVGSVLGQRSRRWSSIDPTLGHSSSPRQGINCETKHMPTVTTSTWTWLSDRVGSVLGQAAPECIQHWAGEPLLIMAMTRIPLERPSLDLLGETTSAGLTIHLLLLQCWASCRAGLSLGELIDSRAWHFYMYNRSEALNFRQK